MLAHGTRFSRFVTVLAVLTLLISTIGGCSLTRQSRSADKSGFLGNYDELKKDDSDDALLTYHNPDAKWSHYTKVKLDSVPIANSSSASCESGTGAPCGVATRTRRSASRSCR